MEEKRIKVIDSLMGTGKSTWAFNHMYENKETKYIYITPYLDEIKRLIGEPEKKDKPCTRTKMYFERGFREPLHLNQGKLESLHQLLIEEQNIVTTHALFKMTTIETVDLIKSGEYTLILDEAMDIVDLFDISCNDYDMLINNEFIEVDKNGMIRWVNDDYEGKFLYLKRQCQNGTVVELKRTKKVQLLAWNFSIESFMALKEVYIMTYLFESSLIKYYFEINNIEYKKYSIQDYTLVSFDQKQAYDKGKIKELINIYDGKLNIIGERRTALSLNWFKDYPDSRKKLKDNIFNYFRNIQKARSEKIIWTTFKSCRPQIQGNGYRKRFISCNTRATNEYIDCNFLAYCCNRFMSPDYVDYFELFDVKVDQDLFALSELLQWLWRSSIRIDKPVSIYIPSKRMRELLIGWLNNPNL